MQEYMVNSNKCGINLVVFLIQIGHPSHRVLGTCRCTILNWFQARVAYIGMSFMTFSEYEGGT